MSKLRLPDSDDHTLMDCKWFVTCNREASMVVDHPILGPTPCCSRCAQQVGIEVPEDPDIIGWRFIIHYKTKHGVRRFKRVYFHNPDRDTCAANVRINFNNRHARLGDVIESIEWTSSIARGVSVWTDTFKKETYSGNR